MDALRAEAAADAPGSSDLESGQAKNTKTISPEPVEPLKREENDDGRVRIPIADRLPLLQFSDADTLVFIDPIRSCEDDFPALDEVQSIPLRVHSAKLLASNSSVFRELFGPTAQFRMTRRRKCLPLPSGVRFVLDLSPPDEGDVAVALTSDLCCSESLRQWHLSAIRFGTPPTLVCGEDECEDTRRPARSGGPAEKGSEPWSNASGQQSILSAVSGLHVGEEPVESGNSGKVDAPTEQQMPLDYTASRHRSGIERLLHVLEGLDPQIDSAVKMWTLFGLAKYFDCCESVVDWIVPWIYSPGNTAFIEVLPEASARVADGLRNYDLCRDSFAILVGESALESLRKQNTPGLDERFSAFGRRREDMNESLQTRIEYASKSLAERVQHRFRHLVDETERWFEWCPEYGKIIGLAGSSEAVERTARQLRQVLRDYMVARIREAVDDCQVSGHLIRSEHPAGAMTGPLSATGSKSAAYGGLSVQERLLTRTCWHRLWRGTFLMLPSPLSHDSPLMQASSAYNRAVSLDLPATASTTAPSSSMWSSPDWRAAATHLKTLTIRPKSTSEAAAKSASAPTATGLGGDRPVWEMYQTTATAAAKSEAAASDRTFSFTVFFRQAAEYGEAICLEVLRRPLSFDSAVTETLSCVEDEEYKYLPLWAGGNDDGSGGVYDPVIPNADAGPSRPGPGLHSGVDGSEGSGVSLIDGATLDSVDTSLAVEDGHSDHLDRRRVFSEGSFEDDDSLWEAVPPLTEEKAMVEATRGAGKEEESAMTPGQDEEGWDEDGDETFLFTDDGEGSE